MKDPVANMKLLYYPPNIDIMSGEEAIGGTIPSVLLEEY
jgi:hypothetical protein